MPTLKELIDSDSPGWGRSFSHFIEFLIIVSIVSFSIRTLPDLSDKTREFLRIQELVIVIIFTIEYILRIIAEKKKTKYIFSFYGIIDLMAILPFYLTAGVDLKALRMFRLFRLLRTLKLFRYSRAIRRFRTALKLIKYDLIVFFLAACFFIYIAAVGIYYFERAAQPESYKSIFHSLWWSVITLTTVGYGDVYPVTVGGRIFTFFILMIGLGIVAIPTGLLSSAIAETRDQEDPSGKD